MNAHRWKWQLAGNTIQSKLVYSNDFFVTKNGKKNPIVKKTMEINTKNLNFYTSKTKLVRKTISFDCICSPNNYSVYIYIYLEH